MDTGPFPAITPHAGARPADRDPELDLDGGNVGPRRPVRETSVEDLFAPGPETGPSAVIDLRGADAGLVGDGGDGGEHDPDRAAEPALAAAVGGDGAGPGALRRPLADPNLGSGEAERGAPAHRRPDRLRVVADTDGPRVRLGLLWLAVGAGALAASAYLAAVVFALVAAVGAVQTGAALRRAHARPRPLVAGAAAFVVVAAGAAPTSRVVGLAVLMALVGTLISGLHIGGFDLDAAGMTVRSWLGIAVAGVAPVVFARAEPALAVLLFVLVCTYDAGDFLVGTASANGVEGPLAGMVGVLAVGGGAAILHPGALADHRLWPVVILTTVACPVGQLAGSAMLPRAGAYAPALRRLDSLIITGLVWILLLG
jgi:hypothetical protein